jgi:signal transduction histidine kinase/DNA-binding response OmpR family regulator
MLMRTLFKKFAGMKLSYAQILFVFIAFALMIIVSYTYGNERERHHLMRRAEDTLTNAKVYIETSLQEPKATFVGISESVRLMILRNASSDEIHQYLINISDHLAEDIDLRHYSGGVFGVFRCFDCAGMVYLDGSGWEPSDDYDPTTRPWYEIAILADGEIGMTDPYYSLAFDALTVTYSRLLYDDGGESLGVVSLDVMLGHITEFAIGTRLTYDGYGILSDANLDVIAHPIPAFLGRNITLLNDGDLIAADIRSGRPLGTFDATDYRGERAELMWMTLDNGWVMSIITPYYTYYQSIRDMAWHLGILGSVLAICLGSVLLSVTAAKMKSDEESRQKSNFLATVSHEIRTPLNAIIGVTEIELMDAKLTRQTRESLLRVYNSGYALLAIINDLLDLSKIEAGKMEIIPARYEVASLINDVIHYNLVKVAENLPDFKLLIDENTPAAMIGDEIRIKQVLNNLLSNAFKYTSEGTVTLAVTSGEDNDGTRYIEYTISDTGYGMSQEQISKLFDAYTRFMTHNEYGAIGGTGLGMNITKHLLDLMGGSITVTSTIGEGTVFTVKIPQLIDSDKVLGRSMAESLEMFRADIKALASSVSFVREYMPYGNVLVVDDMESNLYVAKGLLAPYGLTIDTVTSGQEAIKRIKDGNVYDIILMDHMMPVMDGMEATGRIRDMDYDNPIVALTANAMQGQAEIFLSNGFDDFLSKPVDIRQLDLTLNRLIRDRYPADVIEKARLEKQSINNAGNNKSNAASEASAGSQVIVNDAELARLFVRDGLKVADMLDAVRGKMDNPDENDLKVFASGVHSIKSALAHIGEPGLQATAYTLEQAARKRDLDIIAAATDKFISDLRAVIEKVKPDEEDAYTALSNDEKAFLSDKWFTIYTECITGNKEEAMDNLNLIKDKTWPSEIIEAIEAIEELILNGEFSKAADMAERESGRSL